MENQRKCLIIPTKGVKEYRATVPKYINSHDIVLEIGFAWGTTTNLIAQYAKKVVGIDKGESYWTAVKTYPDLELYKLDGFRIDSVLDLGYDFNKIYIDISGCRSIFQVMKIVLMYKGAFRPELIVVKSTQLKRFVSECSLG
ncbi:hypothetical protein GF357_02525 [Candidatus Dojkabacteria bacterium]|nr:hypothetical protein [Candidatus Dojkabacteria bacterium]